MRRRGRQSGWAGLVGLAVGLCLSRVALASTGESKRRAVDARPDIVIILADDMGFSDAGCYGSEIATPNLDRLASQGLRFTQFYNAARCCPTRASLLTGLYPHQCGIGHMTDDRGIPGYRGVLCEQCVTIAEVLRHGGYRTAMSGKWHLGMQPSQWPVRHGFDRYFGQLSGACNYFHPEPGRVMALDEKVYHPPAEGFYITDAITDYAVRFLDEAAGRDEPYFLYVAYTAPHAPLHALPEDIARYRGKYLAGWDVIRQRRYRRMIEMGLIQSDWPLAPRNPGVPAWREVSDKEEQDLWMAVYAAQIDRMDQGIGRILARIAESGREDNTLVLFLSDNGGDAEDIDEGKPGALVGTADSYRGYASPWAGVSNTPFRRYKRQVHEGGIATPLIVRWPAVARQQGGIVREPAHVLDLMATCCEASGVQYPRRGSETQVKATSGKSLVPLLAGREWEGHDCLYWEHEGNRAVRCGQWKLVAVEGGLWELYDMAADRTELNDLAASKPDLVQALDARYAEWARDCGVVEWKQLPSRR